MPLLLSPLLIVLLKSKFQWHHFIFSSYCLTETFFIALSRDGKTVFMTDPRYADAFDVPLRLVLKLDRAMNVKLPPYTFLKSAIKSSRISSLGLCGQNNLIKSNEDIKGIQEILNCCKFSYDKQTMIFTTRINDHDIKLNLVFSGVGSELRIQDRLVRAVNTTGCKEDRTAEGENLNSIVVSNT